jgi:hypothetical protein
MDISTYSKALRAGLSFVISVGLVHSPFSAAQATGVTGELPTAYYKPFTVPTDPGQAKVTIQAAERRPVTDFSLPNADAEFYALIQANVITKLIDDPNGFLGYFSTNRAKLLEMASISMEGQPIQNWQMFLANAYVSYKIEKTQAAKNPEQMLAWIKSAMDSEWVGWASVKTLAMLYGAYRIGSGVFGFFGNVAYGSVIAGPGAGAVNAVTTPIMNPINQWLYVKGNKFIGPVGIWISSRIFDKSTASELKSASQTVDSLKDMIAGRHYTISGEQWSGNHKTLFGFWNQLNYLWGLYPEIYKFGRDRHLELGLMRPGTFANWASTSMATAEMHLQGAERLLETLINRGAPAAEVDAIAREMQAVLTKQVSIERDKPERAAELAETIDLLKSRLTRLGATTEQVERIDMNYRNRAVFMRQAATNLAMGLLHDAMYHKAIEGVRSVYEEIFKNTSLSHLHGQMKGEVIEILDRMQFHIEAKLAVVNSRSGKGQMSVEQKIQQITQGRESQRVIGESGSVTSEPARNSEERAREAAGRALRK